MTTSHVIWNLLCNIKFKNDRTINNGKCSHPSYYPQLLHYKARHYWGHIMQCDDRWFCSIFRNYFDPWICVGLLSNFPTILNRDHTSACALVREQSTNMEHRDHCIIYHQQWPDVLFSLPRMMQVFICLRTIQAGPAQSWGRRNFPLLRVSSQTMKWLITPKAV